MRPLLRCLLLLFSFALVAPVSSPPPPPPLSPALRASPYTAGGAVVVAGVGISGAAQFSLQYAPLFQTYLSAALNRSVSLARVVAKADFVGRSPV